MDFLRHLQPEYGYRKRAANSNTLSELFQLTRVIPSVVASQQSCCPFYAGTDKDIFLT
jgi:hypothetical protein